MGGGSGGSGSGGRSGGGGGSTGPGDGVQSDISEIFPRGVSGGIPVTGQVDYTKPYTLVVSGNTYGYKDDLKAEGFKWNGDRKTWDKSVTPPDKPNPYGGTVKENQKAALSRTIASAGKGKRASQNLKGEIVQSGATPKTTAPAKKSSGVTREMTESYRKAYPGAKGKWKKMDWRDKLDADIGEGGRLLY